MSEQGWKLSQWLTYSVGAKLFVSRSFGWGRTEPIPTGWVFETELLKWTELSTFMFVSAFFPETIRGRKCIQYEWSHTVLIRFPGTLCLAYLPTRIYSLNQPPIKELRHNIDHTLSQTFLTFFDDVIHAEKLQVHCIQQDPSNMPFETGCFMGPMDQPSSILCPASLDKLFKGIYMNIHDRWDGNLFGGSR